MKKLHEQEERESMEVLRGLALEIQDMDEDQSQQTLQWVTEKETSGDGNRFWLLIAKLLLAHPELIHRALRLTEGVAQPASEKEVFNKSLLQVVSNDDTAEHDAVLSSFYNDKLS